MDSGLLASARPRNDKSSTMTAAIAVTHLNKTYASGFQALKDFGITCVISTSFGDIFYNNCFKNGILPVQVSPEDLEKLFDDAERGANATLTVDLPKQEIRGPDGGVVKFDIDAHRKHCLLNGLDDIGLTMVKNDKIGRFEDKSRAARPWV